LKNCRTGWFLLKRNTANGFSLNNRTNAWEQRKLSSIISWSKGNGLAKMILNRNGKGKPVIHYADLYTFGAVENEVISWSESNEGSLIPANSVLFPMSDVTLNGLARTTTMTKPGVYAGGDVLIGELEITDSVFLSYEINTRAERILPMVTGTTVKHINSKSLSELEVETPSLSEQKQIGSFFQQLDSLITLHQR